LIARWLFMLDTPHFQKGKYIVAAIFWLPAATLEGGAIKMAGLKEEL
jgi:hypothetical protein